MQYAEFEWQRMESEHFDVYFFAEEEQLAAYAAQMAERQFVDLEKKFSYPLKVEKYTKFQLCSKIPPLSKKSKLRESKNKLKIKGKNIVMNIKIRFSAHAAG